MNFLYILLALVIFGALIFFHELGHFLVARACGVKINEFSIGMGPKLFSHRSEKSGTAYSLRLFPIGGYVSMLEEADLIRWREARENKEIKEEKDFFTFSPAKKLSLEDEEALKKCTYSNQKPWKKILIAMAGPLMNLLLGFLVMFIMVAHLGIDYLGTTVVADFLENSTSEQSGLQAGDEIVKIGSAGVHTYYELSYEVLNQGYRPVDVTVKRNGEKLVLHDVRFPQTVSDGVTFGSFDFRVYREEKLDFPTYLKHSFWQSCSSVKMVFDSIKGLIFGRYGMEAVSGPIGVTETITTAAKTGLDDVLYLVAIISINLGLMNLLPFPALDGGQIVLFVIELFRRKQMPQSVVGFINFLGLVILMILAVLIAIKDVIAL